MAIRQYVGARYVPKFSEINGGVWDNTYSYEALEIVKHGNDYYTSTRPVPTGIDILNTVYWRLTGNYNGAIATLDEKVEQNTSDIEEINAKLSGNFVNALSLGIKNDGSEDISTIFNSETYNYDIFFPAGTYLVSNTLHPVHAIMGAVPCNLNNAGTLFLSDIETTNDSAAKAVIECSSGVNTICNCKIQCNDNGIGIKINPTSEYPRINIYNVLITNVGYCGLQAENSENAINPRIEVHNLHILGRNDLHNTGISLASKYYDSFFNDVFIQYFETGIRNMSGFTMWTGLNIFCGFTSDTHVWNNTIGFLLSGSSCMAIVTNVYIDTCHTCFYCADNSNISVVNFFNYNETGIAEYASGQIRVGNVTINNGMVYNYGKITIPNTDRYKIYNDLAFTQSNFPYLSKIRTGEYFYNRMQANAYSEILCANIDGGYGFIKAEIDYNYLPIRLVISLRNFVPTITAVNEHTNDASTVSLYYLIENNLLHIYVGTGNSTYCCVKYTSPQFDAINPDLNYTQLGVLKNFNNESSSTGLTPITIT